MPQNDREGSREREQARERERERSVRHQHSSSEASASRTPIPMWDSSDPERAPPPLPLNPSSPRITTGPNTSAVVAAAAAALTERARESAGASAYTTNPMPNREMSPTKGLLKNHHKRMQSLHSSSSNVRDMGAYIENGSARNTDRTPEQALERYQARSTTPTSFYKDAGREPGSRSPEKSPTRSDTLASYYRDIGKDTPITIRQPLRPQKSILGENTPPTSATLLAIQNMPTVPIPEPIKPEPTVSSALVRTPQTFDALSTQILSLTSIATNLQREMAQLSRRSKDNATDLISLKEATNARDEDIRQSLKELVRNLSQGIFGQKNDPNARCLRDSPGDRSSYMLDNGPYSSPPGTGNHTKSVHLPRIPSPSSFAASIEREYASSPHSIEGTASLAMLEKIIRDMGTKEGQERLLASLSELVEKMNKDGMETAKKLEEIVEFIKKGSGTQVATRLNGLAPISGNGGGNGDIPRQLELDFENPAGPLARTSKDVTMHGHPSPSGPTHANNSDRQKPFASPRAADFVGEDILKVLRRLKDSVSENGGLTAEVKALVRELRGEVLGMGREIGRKLDAAGSARGGDDSTKESAGKEEIAKIVEEGLAELKNHMDRVLRENRRQSSSSTISRSSAVDAQEIYEAVKHALSDLPIQREPVAQGSSGLEKEEILDAVREAWEAYKPEIELQNFGLERDEILQCLREGLEQYKPQQETREVGGINREEILETIRQAMEHFTPPAPIETEAGITKQEVLSAFRECIQTFEFPGSNALITTREPDITKDDLLDAVKEGLEMFEFPSQSAGSARELDLTRDVVLDAVKEGLDGVSPNDRLAREVLERLHEVSEEMRMEFQAVSDEAKQNVAAHGRDTEQVLDAVKDGLEHLRADIEKYVDQAAQVTGKEEIIEALREGLDRLKGEIGSSVVRSSDMVSEKDDIVYALRDGMDTLRSEMVKIAAQNDRAAGMDEILEALNNGLDTLRDDVEKIMDKPVDMTISYEILDTLKDGIAGVRADIDRLRADQNNNLNSESGEILDDLKDGIAGLRADIDRLRTEQNISLNSESGEILDDLKDGITGLRADIDRLRTEQKSEIDHLRAEQKSEESSESSQRQLIIPDAAGLRRDDIENLEVLITQLRIKVESLDSPEPQSKPEASPSILPENLVDKNDLASLEEMLRNVQAAVDVLSSRGHVEDEQQVKKEDVDAIETLLRNTKAKIDEIADPLSSIRKDDLDHVEALVKESKDAFEVFAARVETEGAKHEDMRVMEALLREVRAGLETVKENTAFETDRVTKLDIETLGTLCADTNARIVELVLPDPELFPSKADLDALGDIILDYKEKVDEDTKTTARAIEDRKVENEGLGITLEEVKSFLADLREELKLKLEEGVQNVDELGNFLEELGQTIDTNANNHTDLKELMEIVTREFDRCRGSIEDGKLGTEEKAAEMLVKLEETRQVLLGELSGRIDEGFDQIIAKYNEVERILEEKDVDKDNIVSSTKAIAEDLKALVETLTATVHETSEKIGEDSKTVYNRVDDTFVRVEELHNSGREEHHQTRHEIVKAVAAVEGLGSTVMEYQPKILSTVKDVLSIVGQHYEHAQQQAIGKKNRVSSTSSVPPQALIRDVAEKYDDTEVQTKLDRLLNHATSTGKSFAQIDLLDQIHQQVMTTATEVSAFVAAQAKLITEDHENKEKRAEEAAIALERRLAQKETVETEVVRLREESEELRDAVAALRAEREALAADKIKLTADVSGLETAVRLRREELAQMESRAEGLERRILEGIIDHSRALLISRNSKDTKNMSLKRVPSHASSTRHSLSQSGIGMALKTRAPGIQMNPAGASNSGRRILSLNQITGNTQTGNPNFVGAPVPQKGLTNLKRSQSVRTGTGTAAVGNYMRKSSWGGSKPFDNALDKENDTFREEEDGSDDDVSESTETERRTSYGGSHLGTELTLAEDPGAQTGDEIDVHGGKMILYGGHEEDDFGDDEESSRRMSSSTVNITIGGGDY